MLTLLASSSLDGLYSSAFLDPGSLVKLFLWLCKSVDLLGEGADSLVVDWDAGDFDCVSHAMPAAFEAAGLSALRPLEIRADLKADVRPSLERKVVSIGLFLSGLGLREVVFVGTASVGGAGKPAGTVIWGTLRDLWVTMSELFFDSRPGLAGSGGAGFSRSG